MSRFIFLAPNLAVSGALLPEDFAQAASQGFRTIINNRTDGEDADQLSSSQEASLAAEAGLVYHGVPAAKYEVLDDHILTALEETLDRAEGPVLLHCRSGLRSAIMWAAVQARRGAPVERIFAAAKLAGIDLTPVRDEIIDLARQSRAVEDEARAAA